MFYITYFLYYQQDKLYIDSCLYCLYIYIGNMLYVMVE